jgi:DNA helicase-2/ATP-dependent DNA helicase PcrA
MLLQGAISSEKTSRLVENYTKLLNSGVDSSKILVILQNSNKKNSFMQEVFEKLTVDAVEKLQVYSFFGLVYNTIMDNWAFIENHIPNDENTAILPNLVGLEVSQFILRDILSNVKFEGYNSKKSLLHQLFRRYSLIVQNDLDDKDVKWRSEILKEGFAPDAKKALDEFKSKTLNARGLDYLRQTLIFNYVYKNTDYFSKIEYVFVDDGDEMTPICLNFLEYLAPQLKDAFVAYDKVGGTRLGYLSAAKTAASDFEKIFNQSPVELETKTKLKDDAQTIFNNVVEQKYGKLKNFSLFSISKRAQMLDLAVREVKSLIDKGANPSEIAIISPLFDDMLRFCLKENFKNSFVNLLFLSGSEKLVQNTLVLASLTILKLCDEDLKKDLSEFEIRAILSNFLQIPLKYCKDILENFEKNSTFIDFEFEHYEYTEKYQKFLKLLEKLPEVGKLSEQVYEIFNNLVEISNYKHDEINKFNFFIKQLEDFENVFSAEVIKIKKNEIIVQIENSIIAENPYSTLEIKENDLIVATPQKIIDSQFQTKYQIWLDVSSDEWIKSDTGPLYNAWVFQAGWEKDDFTLTDNIELSSQKTARILRKLTLCAGEKIYAYVSLFDGSGIENFGGIEKYLNHEKELQNSKSSASAFQIIPRDDQKPVLDYKNGTMAISAVPGAGKTTILLALIIKLLNDGVNPENIFVLTYMESAARNFRERIQNANPQSSQLPNISTIHGLALKILKENSNFERLGLNADFEICDDTQRSRILREISAKYKIKPTEQKEFDRACSVLKIGSNGVDLEELTIPKGKTAVEVKKMEGFSTFFKEYQSILKSNNLIDYDDMLLFSVKLLEENPDILSYYQQICHYIIEDEAQDSSEIQQRLINLLSAKYNNLIRCGDINQAITTTFSNADVEGFRKFIQTSQSKIAMDCSQRCAKEVWELANSLITYAEAAPETKNAFYKIFMRPVDSKNPQEKNSIVPVLFENDFNEKNYILKEIKSLMSKNPKATFAILLRSNFQVGRWTTFINNSGMKAITRSECLEQKGIFRTIFAILKIVLDPFNNENIAKNYEILAELGHYKSNLDLKIKNYSSPFFQTNLDDIEDVNLAQFYWDLVYWLSFSALPTEELAIKIGLYYYNSDIEKSNVYLIATLIKRLSMVNKKYSSLIERLLELSKKPNLSGFKFFGEEDDRDREFLSGKVQIMTLHKSKGDEFDYVFLPELTENSLTMNFDSLKLKGDSRFMENIREIIPNYKPKNDVELKEFLLAENLRLFYVAVTRAKRKLFITVSKTSKSFGKMVNQVPSVMFTDLLKVEESLDE